MTKTVTQYRSSVWFVTVFSMFFGRGILNASWTSRGPDVRDTLGVSTADMGIIATVFAAGAIIGVLASGAIIERYGSRAMALGTYLVMPISLIAAIFGLQPLLCSFSACRLVRQIMCRTSRLLNWIANRQRANCRCCTAAIRSEFSLAR